MISNELLGHLHEKGYVAQIVDSTHIGDLKTELERTCQDYQIDTALIEQYLTRLAS